MPRHALGKTSVFHHRAVAGKFPVQISDGFGQVALDLGKDFIAAGSPECAAESIVDAGRFHVEVEPFISLEEHEIGPCPEAAGFSVDLRHCLIVQSLIPCACYYLIGLADYGIVEFPIAVEEIGGCLEIVQSRECRGCTGTEEHEVSAVVQHDHGIHFRTFVINGRGDDFAVLVVQTHYCLLEAFRGSIQEVCGGCSARFRIQQITRAGGKKRRPNCHY